MQQLLVVLLSEFAVVFPRVGGVTGAFVDIVDPQVGQAFADVG